MISITRAIIKYYALGKTYSMASSAAAAAAAAAASAVEAVSGMTDGELAAEILKVEGEVEKYQSYLLKSPTLWLFAPSSGVSPSSVLADERSGTFLVVGPFLSDGVTLDDVDSFREIPTGGIAYDIYHVTELTEYEGVPSDTSACAVLPDPVYGVKKTRVEWSREQAGDAQGFAPDQGLRYLDRLYDSIEMLIVSNDYDFSTGISNLAVVEDIRRKGQVLSSARARLSELQLENVRRQARFEMVVNDASHQVQHHSAVVDGDFFRQRATIPFTDFIASKLGISTEDAKRANVYYGHFILTDKRWTIGRVLQKLTSTEDRAVLVVLAQRAAGAGDDSEGKRGRFQRLNDVNAQ